jgi:uncharacterized protein (UPF0210 family)
VKRSSFFGLGIVVLLISIQTVNANNFRIRTITAGISLASLSDTLAINKAIKFLKTSKADFVKLGYEVQTLRIVTQNVYEYLGDKSYADAIPYLIVLDKIAKREGILICIGELLPSNVYKANIAGWVVALIHATDNILFSLPISSTAQGVYPNSIKMAAEITIAISKASEGGEGNFRFTASANCPAEIPFFPAAWHKGNRSFGIGLELPNVLRDVFIKSDWTNAKANLKGTLESILKPIESLATKISKTQQWSYNGIDASPAPGFDASIGEAIESLTHQPFGGPSTLRACALITDVLKNLSVKTCGYSGLMLPVVEDITLANRCREKRFGMQELLLFSSVSGTGLDLIPLPGNTSAETLERIYYDVAALSLKYTNKALSARILLVEGKVAGDEVTFKNPKLTSSVVMKVE